MPKTNWRRWRRHVFDEFAQGFDITSSVLSMAVNRARGGRCPSGRSGTAGGMMAIGDSGGSAQIAAGMGIPGIGRP